MPTVDESLAQLGNSKIFPNWMPIVDFDVESRHLTFDHLPFGISSAPEIFQRTMSQFLQGLEGVICKTDDILVHGVDQKEHDERLRATLQRLQEAGVTLNDKCEFSKLSIKFLAHIIDRTGIQADPEKITTITQFPEPTNIPELQRFLGMANHLGKFIPHLAETSEPLRQQLLKDSIWSWGETQKTAFNLIKFALVSPDVLAHYNPRYPTIVSADASNQGLGAVLLQVEEDGKRHPICYASRSLTDAEKRYAVIDKEALAVTWAREKFSAYISGLHYTIETDHKPLTVQLASTELSKMPPRILRFRLRLMRYTYEMKYVPGKHQITADALSRAPSKGDSPLH